MKEFPIAVIMERRRLDNPWVDAAWEEGSTDFIFVEFRCLQFSFESCKVLTTSLQFEDICLCFVIFCFFRYTNNSFFTCI